MGRFEFEVLVFDIKVLLMWFVYDLFFMIMVVIDYILSLFSC